MSGLVQSEMMNNPTTAKQPEKDQKANKSFSGTTTTASKKQKQTIKGMFEGLNTTQNSSIPGSSSKRKNVSEILVLLKLCRVIHSTWLIQWRIKASKVNNKPRAITAKTQICPFQKTRTRFMPLTTCQVVDRVYQIDRSKIRPMANTLGLKAHPH